MNKGYVEIVSIDHNRVVHRVNTLDVEEALRLHKEGKSSYRGGEQVSSDVVSVKIKKDKSDD